MKHSPVTEKDYELAHAIFIVESKSLIHEEVTKEHGFEMIPSGNYSWVLVNKEGKIPPYKLVHEYHRDMENRLMKAGIGNSEFLKSMLVLRKHEKSILLNGNPKGVW